jgi:hypothetical protein
MSILAFLSAATCGLGCWEAREEICKCSCGGKNHGIRRRDKSAIPERVCKIDGRPFRLAGIGKHKDLYSDAAEALAAFLVSAGIETEASAYTLENGQRSAKGWLQYRVKEKGCAVRLKYATLSQLQKWPELQAYGVTDARGAYFADIGLLWVRQ